MNINLYLPDDLGHRAKEAELPLSAMLRAAVVEELGRREAVTATLADAGTYDFVVEDRDGRPYTARLHGSALAEPDRNNVQAFIGEDERLYVYEGDRERLHEDVQPDDLRDWIVDNAIYVEAMAAIGETAVIEIGR